MQSPKPVMHWPPPDFKDILPLLPRIGYIAWPPYRPSMGHLFTLISAQQLPTTNDVTHISQEWLDCRNDYRIIHSKMVRFLRLKAMTTAIDCFSFAYNDNNNNNNNSEDVDNNTSPKFMNQLYQLTMGVARLLNTYLNLIIPHHHHHHHDHDYCDKRDTLYPHYLHTVAAANIKNIMIADLKAIHRVHLFYKCMDSDIMMPHKRVEVLLPKLKMADKLKLQSQDLSQGIVIATNQRSNVVLVRLGIGCYKTISHKALQLRAIDRRKDDERRIGLYEQFYDSEIEQLMTHHLSDVTQNSIVTIGHEALLYGSTQQFVRHFKVLATTIKIQEDGDALKYATIQELTMPDSYNDNGSGNGGDNGGDNGCDNDSASVYVELDPVVLEIRLERLVLAHQPDDTMTNYTLDNKNNIVPTNSKPKSSLWHKHTKDSPATFSLRRTLVQTNRHCHRVADDSIYNSFDTDVDKAADFISWYRQKYKALKISYKILTHFMVSFIAQPIDEHQEFRQFCKALKTDVIGIAPKYVK